MTRRRFAFWLGLGLFSVGAKLRFDPLDEWAAAIMRRTEPPLPPTSTTTSPAPVHWTATGDDAWRWYEREHFVDGKWMFTGTTTPVNKRSGKRQVAESAHLDEHLVPAELRRNKEKTDLQTETEPPVEFVDHQPSAARRARHGRPPSKWLRSLHADEIRIWLGTIEVPEAGVSGMTYWEHLTRDHAFDPLKIAGLTEQEQAKLHAAAHFGY